MRTNGKSPSPDKRYSTPFHPTNTLLKRLATLQQAHRGQILLSKLTSNGKLIVINAKDKSMWGKISTDDLPNLSYGIITNYLYFPRWEAEGRSTPIQVAIKPTPILPQRISLVPIEEDQNNLRSLIVPASQRTGRLAIQRIYISGNEALCLYDNNTKKAVSIFPPAPTAQWLKWQRKDAHHALHVDTDWHITLGSTPKIEVTIYPYWAPSSKKTLSPAPLNIQEHFTTEQAQNQINAWLDRLNAKDTDSGGHAPARRHKVRNTIRDVVVLNPTDRATFDCLPRKDIDVLLEVIHTIQPILDDLRTTRIRQAGRSLPVQSPTTITSTTAGSPAQIPQPPKPTTTLWTMTEAALFLQANSTQIRNFIEKYPYVVKESASNPLIYADRLALQVNQHCDYKTTMLRIDQVATYCRCCTKSIKKLYDANYLPAFNLTTLTTKKDPKNDYLRFSPRYVEIMLGLPLNTHIVTMKEAKQIFLQKHNTWSDNKISYYITKHAHSLLPTDLVHIKIYAAKDIETLAAQIPS